MSLPHFVFGEGFKKDDNPVKGWSGPVKPEKKDTKSPVKGWSGPIKPEKSKDNPVVGWDDGSKKK